MCGTAVCIRKIRSATYGQIPVFENVTAGNTSHDPHSKDGISAKEVFPEIGGLSVDTLSKPCRLVSIRTLHVVAERSRNGTNVQVGEFSQHELTGGPYKVHYRHSLRWLEFITLRLLDGHLTRRLACFPFTDKTAPTGAAGAGQGEMDGQSGSLTTAPSSLVSANSLGIRNAVEAQS